MPRFGAVTRRVVHRCVRGLFAGGAGSGTLVAMSNRKGTPANRPAPRIKEMMQRGWCRRDAEHLGVVELALDVGPRLETSALRVLAGHVATALMWEPVYVGAQANYVDEQQAPTWHRLAECVDGAAKRRMLALAAICEGREERRLVEAHRAIAVAGE